METKRCKECDEVKPVAEFYRAGKYYQPRCKPCHNRYNLDRYYALSSDAKAERIASIKARYYGMTLAEMQALVEAHDDNCDLCGKPDTTHRKRTWTRQLTMDHDHVSKKFRGFLCSKCNIAIGSAGDDPDLLERMAEYVRRFR